MNRSRTNQRRYRLDAPAPRTRSPRSRRLAFEAMEGRLLLSGTQLDTSIFNLDSIQSSYAIIPSTDGAISDAVSHVDAPAIAQFHWNVATQSGLGPSLLIQADRSLNHVTQNLFDFAATPWFSIDVVDVDHDGTFAPVHRSTHQPADQPMILDRTEFGDWGGSAVVAQDNPPGTAAGGSNIWTTDVLLGGDTGSSQVAVVDAADEDVGGHVAESGGDVLEIVEGGAISIERLVATLQTASGVGVEGDEPLIADKEVVAVSMDRVAGENHSEIAAGEVSGELSRAVAFEILDGDAVPIGRPDGGGEQASITVRGGPSANEQLPSVPEAPAGPIRLATYVASAADGLHLQLVSSGSTDGPRVDAVGAYGRELAADSVRDEVFALWARSSKGDRLASEEESHLSFDLMPILGILAWERLAASRKNGDRSASSRGMELWRRAKKTGPVA